MRLLPKKPSEQDRYAKGLMAAYCRNARTLAWGMILLCVGVGAGVGAGSIYPHKFLHSDLLVGLLGIVSMFSMVTAPAYLIAGTILIALEAIWGPGVLPPGHCRCGYNLTGNVSGVCSECGTAVSGHRTEATNVLPPDKQKE